jgi:transcriptional repressor NrdR
LLFEGGAANSKQLVQLILVCLRADEGSLMPERIKMRCPFCGADKSRVVDTTQDVARDEIRRRRLCSTCGRRFTSYERARLVTPLIVKTGQPGRREEFDPDKLRHGIRIACAKRPITTAAVDQLLGDVEARLQEMGVDEVPSRVVGDMVMDGLRELDEIAYIRYAIVYLGLDDLTAVRGEIDRLLTGDEMTVIPEDGRSRV